MQFTMGWPGPLPFACERGGRIDPGRWWRFNSLKGRANVARVVAQVEKMRMSWRHSPSHHLDIILEYTNFHRAQKNAGYFANIVMECIDGVYPMIHNMLGSELDAGFILKDFWAALSWFDILIFSEKVGRPMLSHVVFIAGQGLRRLRQNDFVPHIDVWGSCFQAGASSAPRLLLRVLLLTSAHNTSHTSTNISRQ